MQIIRVIHLQNQERQQVNAKREACPFAIMSLQPKVDSTSVL